MTAKIVGARIAAAHEGIAELILDIEYQNGTTSEVVLDSVGSQSLLDSCQAKTTEELIGHSWEKVRDALTASYNRY